MIRNVVFVVFWGILLRPTAGAVVSFPKCNTLQNVHWLCVVIHNESYAISLCVAIYRDVCREHSLIGRRNCLMIEVANSLSAAAGPELSTTRNPIANLASDSATAGLAWVRACVLWHPGASVRRMQGEL